MYEAEAMTLRSELSQANERVAALEAELAALKAPTDWTYIYIKAGRPETWPPLNEKRVLSFWNDGRLDVAEGYRVNSPKSDPDMPVFRVRDGWLTFEVYAHAPAVLPAPAPYPGREE